jgi:hypothetical protein
MAALYQQLCENDDGTSMDIHLELGKNVLLEDLADVDKLVEFGGTLQLHLALHRLALEVREQTHGMYGK